MFALVVNFGKVQKGLSKFSTSVCSFLDYLFETNKEIFIIFIANKKLIFLSSVDRKFK